jgi:hypothetical protein
MNASDGSRSQQSRLGAGRNRPARGLMLTRGLLMFGLPVAIIVLGLLIGLLVSWLPGETATLPGGVGGADPAFD